MKKAFVIAVVLLAVLMVFAGSHADSEYSGSWYAYKYVKNGQEYDPSNYKLYQVLALYPAGGEALILRESGNHQEGTWAADEDAITIVANYKSSIFRIEDGMLAQTVDDGTLWFAKETDLNTPNDIKENSEEEYYGTWELYKLSNNGIILTMRMASLLGMDVSGKIEISENSAYFEIDSGKKPVTWNGEPRYANGKTYFGSSAEITMTDSEELYIASDTARYYFKKEKADIGQDEWICPSCGNLANGNFCNNCGQAYQSETQTKNQNDEKNEKLYRGEYITGTDLQPGVYILAADELEYDWMWEINKASIRVLDYIETEKDWVKKEYESVGKKGQKIKITLETGQKLKIESGSFDVVSYQTEFIEDKEKGVEGKELYLGEYVVGTDLLPGAYTLSASELEYDILWEVNKAAIRTYEYKKSERDWVKKDYESVNKKGQKIRITIDLGEKIAVEAGAFEIVSFEYRASAKQEEISEEETEPENEPWFETGVGSKLPKPISISGKVLKASSYATSNGDSSFSTIVSASKKDYKKYITALRDWGFNINDDEVDTAFASTFSAENGEGYKVSLTYSSFVGITVSAYAPD